MSDFISAPKELKTELLSDALGVASQVPAFSWVMCSHLPGDSQSAYRLVISDSIDALRGCEYIFDSGKLFSSQSVCVRPEGLRGILKDNSIYYWLVYLWNKDGVPVAVPEAAFFTTAIGSDWLSRDFIRCDTASNFFFLRSEFSYSSKYRLDKAVLSVTALSHEKSRRYVCSIYLNGEYVGCAPALPGEGSDDEILYYHSFDVTGLLREGNNAVGALCCPSGKEGGLLCQLTVFFTNGLKKVLFNSGADCELWRALDGAAVYGKESKESTGTEQNYAPRENIDGRAFPIGWTDIGFKADIAWLKARSVGAPDARVLTSYPEQNPYRLYVGAKSVQKIGRHRFLIDLGKEIEGGLQLRIDGKAAKIRLRFINEPAGGHISFHVRTGNRHEETWRYKKGGQTLESFGIKRFRYVELSGCPAEITTENVTGIALCVPVDKNASCPMSSEDNTRD